MWPIAAKVVAEEEVSSEVEILCIGTELLLGNIVNGNARWLAEELASLGFAHYRQTVVGDNVERLSEAVLEAADRCSLLITTARFEWNLSRGLDGGTKVGIAGPPSTMLVCEQRVSQ